MRDAYCTAQAPKKAFGSFILQYDVDAVEHTLV